MDFDGDEMNLHVPQNVTARAEAENLMMVHRLIVSPQSNKPVMGIIQDSLLASALMTRRDTFIERDLMMNLMMQLETGRTRVVGKTMTPEGKFVVPEPAVMINLARLEEKTGFELGGGIYSVWSGKQIFSMLIPDEINLQRKSNGAPDRDNNMTLSDTRVKIIKGNLVSGIVDKKTIGTSEGSLIHVLFNDLGPESTKKFMNRLQRLVNYWILNNSFSIGIGDAVADDDTKQSIDTILENVREKVKKLVKKKDIDKTKLENMINSELNGARDEAGRKAQQSLTHHNNFKATVEAGSKGNNLNISQIIGTVGQQNIEGKRVSYGFRKRTLPHYKKNDMGQESRGFVENSYLKGLTPQEFFFHAMAGREGLIDTACKSLVGDTPIVLMENGKTKRVLIGDWIDEKMKKRENEIKKQNLPNEDKYNMELLNLTEKVYIPTADNKGNTSWGEVTIVTRHDPGEFLYEVVTRGGRKVIVANSKSVLIWNNDKKEFIETDMKNVQVGDYMPVTMKLPKPPKVTKYVELSDYLPKTDFLYGTEFLIAAKELDAVMEMGLLGDKAGKKAKEEFKREKVPRGWWEKTNGTTFTVPYDSKAKFFRSLWRSGMYRIKKGYVYPFTTNRRNPIPDKFHFTEENGVFIGLFLAEGNVDIPSGYIQITNNDPEIRKFSINWFKKHNLKYKENIRKFDDGSTSSDVRGYSVLLAKFLTKWLGHRAENKYVPDEVFSAPKKFIRGLLNGYFSGDGHVSKRERRVCVTSASSRLIEGVSLLCSRFGIYGKLAYRQQTFNNKGTKNILPNYSLSIGAQWAQKFADKIKLIQSDKQHLLEIFQEGYDSPIYKNVNNVIKDPIEKIIKLDSKKYPKVYDITVPSTLHFGIANGLQVMDKAVSIRGPTMPCKRSKKIAGNLSLECDFIDHASISFQCQKIMT